MYLKALEIQGFKSFPEKTRIVFEKDITAIVGPNGSGKSNISDAILWVMGEQRTRTLRGGKMEDVIFGGTQRRSALGFAQVSLIIDNSEGIFNTESSEVMITRRYYRSGESEYFINRQSSRLKDLTELLLDTGLGRYGYSIIGQGRIADIVSVKNTDRREIFEEAAGISRFRLRKDEAERKLAKTDENLLRINDKIDELEIQVNPLREQAETAKRYLELFDELRGLEVSIWLDSLDKLKEGARIAREDYESALAGLETARGELDSLYASVENYTNRMRERDLESERSRELLSQAEAWAGECESAAAVLRANIANNIDSAERLGREQQEQQGRSRELLRQINGHNELAAAVAKEIESVEAEISGFLGKADKNRQNADSAEQRLSALLAEENAAAELLSGKRAMLTMLREKAQELTDRENALSEQREDALRRRELAALRLEEKKNGLSAARERLLELENVLSGYKIRLSQREKKADELEAAGTSLSIELKSMDSRIAMLTDMEKELQGFSTAVRAVMRESGRGTLRGIHGPVAGLVTTDDKFALAVETALGASMQSIVVETPASGKAAIEFLKRQSAGRGTFLPVSTIRGRSPGRLPSGEEGYLGTALEAVKFDEKYSEIFSSLLGGTVIAETLGHAIKISEKFDNRLKIVSLDGQVINPGGSMTGGSSSKGAGIISRGNELRRLVETRQALAEREKAAAQAALSAKRELDAARYELEVASGERAGAMEDAVRREAALSEAGLVLETAERELSALESERGSVTAQGEENLRKIEAEEDAARQLEEGLESARAAIEEKVKGRDEQRLLLEQLSIRINALRERASALRAQREAAVAGAAQLGSVLRDLDGDSEGRATALSELEAKNAALRLQLAEKEERALDYLARIEKLKTKLAQITETKLQLEGVKIRAEKAVQEKNAQLLDMERLCSRLEQRTFASDMEEKQILDRLWVTYELSHMSAVGIRQEIENPQKAARRVSELRREIAALGQINKAAIEEFERVNTRYTFLAQQRDDVLSSKRELLKIITEITGQMKAIFLREFNAINECFQKTFVELFGGGRAALSLEDESDILGCGIEIKCQPPGKALSTISLLSGGEMAFVAIALYFAILKVRPTPFCVMDEIEAALDESNVLRFAQYMREMSHKTQFLVITHRRGTMEEADMLYGVTMQEKGVSSIISVNLDEAERTIA